MEMSILIGFCSIVVLYICFSALCEYSYAKEKEARQEYLRRQAKEKSRENRGGVSCCGRCYPYGDYKRAAPSGNYSSSLPSDYVETVETLEPLSVDIVAAAIEAVNNYETPSYEHLTVDVPAISYNETVETVETPSVDYTPAYEASSQPDYSSSSESSYSCDSSPSYGDSNAGCDNSSSYDSFSDNA